MKLIARPILPERYFLAMIFLAFFVLLSGVPIKALANDAAATQVIASYLVRDNSTASGYKERIRWVLNSDTWNRLALIVPNMPLDRTENPSPFKSGAEDIIVLTRNDVNGMTGKDIYLSNIGIMVIERSAEHAYFKDTNKFWDFLEEEQGEHSLLENLNEEGFDSKAPGIVVVYNLNQNLANPNWKINEPEALELYQSYMKGMVAYSDYDLKYTLDTSKFDKLGLFTLYLNYDSAPAKVATIAKGSLRLSNPVTSTIYYQDTKDQYTVLKGLAAAMLTQDEKQKKEEREAVSKREF